MLDRAPVLFCSSGYFTCIGDKAITVRTVGAVKFFYEVEIAQVVVIEHHIGRPVYSGNSIESKQIS